MLGLNERRTCCDYGAGTENNWCSRFETSDALMWANRTVCVRSDLGQLGSFSLFFSSQEEHREAPLAEGWSLWCLDPLTGTGHAPLELPRVQKGG